MKQSKSRATVLLLTLGLFVASPARAQVTDELDAYWDEVSRTVAEGDFEGYATLYHPDAVLVSLHSGNSFPIAEALAGWKQGFDDTAAGRAEAGVDFRITRRLHGGTTAHETGIFRYTFTPDGGESVVAPVHFEALLVKKDGQWLMVMEYQKEPATEDEWETALSSGITPASDAETIRRLATEWAAAEAANDIDRTLALMWEDAVMQPPNAPQIEGHEAIRALYESVTFESLDPGPLTSRVSGDLGVVWSPRMIYTLVTPGGPFTNEAKFITVWERRDGEWKALESTWNSNLPAGGGGE